MDSFNLLLKWAHRYFPFQLSTQFLDWCDSDVKNYLLHYLLSNDHEYFRIFISPIITVLYTTTAAAAAAVKICFIRPER